jgi:hypothetical protein
MRDRIAKIEVETGHLVQMVSELMDLSRIEGGGTLSHEGGGEHSADDLDKAICVPTRPGRKTLGEAANPPSDSPSDK